MGLRQQRIKIPWEHTPGGGEQSRFRNESQSPALNLEGAEGGNLPQGRAPWRCPLSGGTRASEHGAGAGGSCPCSLAL